MRKPSLLARGRMLAQCIVPAVIKPAHALWHEVIGFLFLCIAIAFVPSGIRTIRKFDGSIGAILAVAMVVFFISLMAGYGISSFLRARKISRS